MLHNALVFFLQELQQHDVQELNRILFSAIESSLLGTSGEQLISKLYHGATVQQVWMQTSWVERKMTKLESKYPVLKTLCCAFNCLISKWSGIWQFAFKLPDIIKINNLFWTDMPTILSTGYLPSNTKSMTSIIVNNNHVWDKPLGLCREVDLSSRSKMY